MDPVDRFADDLTGEALKEAADTFFGKRRSVEEEIKSFETKAQELRDKGLWIKQYLSAINYLLIQERYALFFWRIFGAEDLARIKEEVAFSELNVPLPSGLSLFGRYFRLLCYLYEFTARQIDKYNNGEYVDHPEIPGKKTVTLNYSYISGWLSDLNSRIDKINYYHKSSDVLQFAKKMDVEEREKEKVAGAEISYNLDNDLKISHLKLENYDLPVFPELPWGRVLKKRMKKECKRFFAYNRENIRSRLDYFAKK